MLLLLQMPIKKMNRSQPRIPHSLSSINANLFDSDDWVDKPPSTCDLFHGIFLNVMWWPYNVRQYCLLLTRHPIFHQQYFRAIRLAKRVLLMSILAERSLGIGFLKSLLNR